jgi:hypothetical protein
LRLVALTVLVAAATIFTAPAAGAHGGETTASARGAVLQAIAYIVNDPGNMDAISDKVGDSLEAEDMSGVDVALVKKARVAVEANQMMRVRTLLERAIGARSDMAGTDMQPILQVPRGSSSLTLAVGTATGTNVVTDELAGRGSLTGADIVLLVLAGLLALTGVLLGFRLRPPDSVRTLRRRARATGGT